VTRETAGLIVPVIGSNKNAGIDGVWRFRALEVLFGNRAYAGLRSDAAGRRENMPDTIRWRDIGESFDRAPGGHYHS
jgi:hypothetical protein